MSFFNSYLIFIKKKQKNNSVIAANKSVLCVVAKRGFHFHFKVNKEQKKNQRQQIKRPGDNEVFCSSISVEARACHELI